jgi:hypothetical protein
MKPRFLIVALSLAAASVATVAPAPSAFAASEVTITVAPAADFSACATVVRSNHRTIKASLSTRGYETQGLGFAQINQSVTSTGTTGLAKPCTSGGFTAENGAVTYFVDWTTGTVTGMFPVVCVATNYAMQCTDKTLTFTDVDPS